jgi:hypothetical protein
MKIFTLLLILGGLSFSAQAGQEKILCSLLHAKAVVTKATAHSPQDKNRHCAVSCLLTLRCPPGEVLLVGVMKEIKDLLGPGQAEVADLEANLTGISLALKLAARNTHQCFEQCDLYYHP